MRSKHGRCESGPVCPNPETDALIRSGLISRRRRYSSPRRSRTPGLEFSTTTSDVGNELAYDLSPFVTGDIDADAALSAVLLDVSSGPTVDPRAVGAVRIAVWWLLDLDDVGPELAEQDECMRDRRDTGSGRERRCPRASGCLRSHDHALGSRGNRSTLSPNMLRMMFDVPPWIVYAGA